MSQPDDKAFREEQEAALQLRAEGTMWATVREIEDRIEANREAKAQQGRNREQQDSHPPQSATSSGNANQTGAEEQTDIPLPSKVSDDWRERHRIRSLEERPHRRGRPPIEPAWLKEAARLVAHGTPLRQALWRLGIRLSDKERRNIYRWVRFRYYYEEYRFHFLQEWGARLSPRAVARLTSNPAEF